MRCPSLYSAPEPAQNPSTGPRCNNRGGWRSNRPIDHYPQLAYLPAQPSASPRKVAVPTGPDQVDQQLGSGQTNKDQRLTRTTRISANRHPRR
jgi:hypothetical protein